MISQNISHKILFIIDPLGGGTGKHHISMIENWNNTKWEKGIFCNPNVSLNIPDNVQVKHLYQSKFAHYPFTQTFQFIQIKRYVGRYRPDLIHAYFFWPIIYARILRRLGKVKALVENREDQGFNWGKHEYSLLRLTRSIPDRVICVSKAVRQVVLKRERLDPKKVVVIHNGIQMPVGHLVDKLLIRKQLGFEEDHLIVGMVANMNRPVKGVTYFLEAIPTIIGAVPEARFVIFGKGEEETSLREKARRLGIDQHLVFAGHRKNMDEYYPIMDVSVLTSLSEGLSMTILESMSYGIPVVVTRVGGNSEIIENGETGYLVPSRNPQAFAERVIELLRNPLHRAQMGEKGLQRMQEYFDIRKVSSRYLRVYEEVLRK